MLPKSETHAANHPRIGVANAGSARMLLGTVPVEAGGSVRFRFPALKPLAAARSASEIAPGSGSTRSWSFPRLVQLLLEERRVRCHDRPGTAKPRLGGADVGPFPRFHASLGPFVRWYEWGGERISQITTRPGEMPADTNQAEALSVARRQRDLLRELLRTRAPGPAAGSGDPGDSTTVACDYETHSSPPLTRRANAPTRSRFLSNGGAGPKNMSRISV